MVSAFKANGNWLSQEHIQTFTYQDCENVRNLDKERKARLRAEFKIVVKLHELAEIIENEQK